MRLQFYGTKGYVEESSRSHAGHSAFVIESDGFRLLCDFGENRKGMLAKIRPDADLRFARAPGPRLGPLGGNRPARLRVGRDARAPEGAAAARPRRARASRDGLDRALSPRRASRSSTRSAARASARGSRAARSRSSTRETSSRSRIPKRRSPARDLYIGDGSTLTGSLVRRHPSGVLLGHTTVRAQLGWLARHGILRAVFSHFGQGPIEMGDAALEEALAKLAAANPPGCAVTAAHDGLELEVGD